MTRRMYPFNELVLIPIQSNIACTLLRLDRSAEALEIMRGNHASESAIHGRAHPNTLCGALNLASSLHRTKRHVEARDFIRENLPIVDGELGQDSEFAIKFRLILSQALWQNDDASLGDVKEAGEILEDICPRIRRVFGATHPITLGAASDLRVYKKYLPTVLLRIGLSSSSP